MATTQTAAPALRIQKPKDHSKRRLIILIVLSAFGAYFLKLSFIFLFIGMMPAMVAYAIDYDKHKYISTTVAAFNFAGVFPYMMPIFNQNGTFYAVRDQLTDGLVWFTMYSAAALGWCVVWMGPKVASLFFEGINKGRIIHLEGLQKKAEEEWGPEITGERMD